MLCEAGSIKTDFDDAFKFDRIGSYHRFQAQVSLLLVFHIPPLFSATAFPYPADQCLGTSAIRVAVTMTLQPFMAVCSLKCSPNRAGRGFNTIFPAA